MYHGCTLFHSFSFSNWLLQSSQNKKTSLAHGSTGQGPETVRFDVGARNERSFVADEVRHETGDFFRLAGSFPERLHRAGNVLVGGVVNRHDAGFDHSRHDAVDANAGRALNGRRLDETVDKGLGGAVNSGTGALGPNHGHAHAAAVDDDRARGAVDSHRLLDGGNHGAQAKYDALDVDVQEIVNRRVVRLVHGSAAAKGARVDKGTSNAAKGSDRGVDGALVVFGFGRVARDDERFTVGVGVLNLGLDRLQIGFGAGKERDGLGALAGQHEGGTFAHAGRSAGDEDDLIGVGRRRRHGCYWLVGSKGGKF